MRRMLRHTEGRTTSRGARRSAKRRRTRFTIPGQSLDLTPMIDIVFQLLLFFVLTAVFVQLEGALDTPLPEDRGVARAPTLPLAGVDIVLEWIGDSLDGRCVARTTNDRGARDARGAHEFRTIAAGAPGARPAARPPEYASPDFDELAAYLRTRKAATDAIGIALPVTVEFDDDVPVQMVVNLVDVCTEVGIADLSLAMPRDTFGVE